MKDLKYKELISYASAFVSFVLPRIEIIEVILFGSVARGDYFKESDIDLFFEVNNKEEKTEEILKKELDRFYKSKIFETFSLRGIRNEISIHVGKLDEWKLKRSVISDGIVLYGKYKKVPEGNKGYVQFVLNPIRDVTKRNKIMRILFGRKEEGYSAEGAIKGIGGRRLSPTNFIVPIEKTNEIIKLLNSNKISYSFFEFWSDVLI